MWWRYEPGEGASGVVGGIAYEVDVRWIPTVDAGYHIGVDGLPLPLLALTGVLFLACDVWAMREGDRPRSLAALFLLLEEARLGTFAALDLSVVFVLFA